MGRVVRSLKHGWHALKKPNEPGFAAGPSSASRPNRSPVRYYSDRTFLSSIYTRLAVDFSMIDFQHVRLDPDNDVAIAIERDSLHDCLTLNPNIDQSAQALKIDFALTLFEQGHAAIVLMDADLDPSVSTSYDVRQLRVASIFGWYPRRVTVMVYDDREVDDEGQPVNGGITKQLTVGKEYTVIVENPFYGIMNEPNGTLQRLLRKMALLDIIDEAAGSSKLDMLIQLPYTVRGDLRKDMAEDRRKDLTEQLQNDPLGIGYIDISEKIIQLNRPIENKLIEQIDRLQQLVFSELGLTMEIMNGTADRDTINNYYDRTQEPIATALAQEIKRKFLTKTARTQRQSIEVYRDPLKLIPIAELAEVADKLIRNAVLTANELRPKIGFLPSKEPGANKLANPNMPVEDQGLPPDPPKEVPDDKELPGQPPS